MKFSRSALRTLACACALISPLSAQTARLINISTRGQVGTDANILVGGFVISGAGNKTVLIRAIGPGLGAFGVTGTLPDPVLSIFNSAGTVVASNDNWNAIDAATFAQVGAFPLPANSKDAVVVATLSAGSYTAQISGLGTARTGVGILEVYDVSGTGQLINIATRLSVGTGTNAAVAGFVISPGSGSRKLLVRGVGPALTGFGVPGALSDPKLTVFDSNVQVIATAVANGSVSALASATAQAGAFATAPGDAATIITVNPGSYTVQLAGNSGATTGVGLIEVYDITNTTGTPTALASPTPRLYYASLRPSAAATTSTASGYATILYDPNTNVATVSVNFSNLSSGATSAHLVIGTNASSGNFVFNLPRGQANALTWTFPASGSYSTTDLIAAMVNGQLFVSIDSSNFPAGELQGGFALTTGSTTFTAPAAPPALAAGALTSPTQTDAARFLTQATYGPTTATINALMTRGISGWLDDQMAAPATSLLGGMRSDTAAFPMPTKPLGPPDPRIYLNWTANSLAAWWKTAITGTDQLRQRVAFALSEILVLGPTGQTEGDAKYYDILVNQAFGNYRQLLEDVTLSPVMGVWLTHIKNPKADPVKGTAPDENYAREVQQLFTIGLVQLQPDGTLLLDSLGQPLPTYNQAIIAETAKVFTGWNFAFAPDSSTNVQLFTDAYPPSTVFQVHGNDNEWLNPMRCYDAFHDKTQKVIVSLQQVPLADAAPTLIPAGQTGPQDLKVLLDTLFNHPNTGPFVCKQLIKRLVTSNPSPAYVYRVAQVFANDGKGARGNLGAVVRSILLDYEARSPAVIENVGYGKIKEPIIRFTGFLRALSATSPNGRYLDSYYEDPRSLPALYPTGTFVFPLSAFGQAPLQSPTVFNFYSPDYSPPGAMAAAGLVAPEMEITDAYFAMSVPFAMVNLMHRDPSRLPAPSVGPSPFLVLDYSAYLPNAKNPSALVDQLNLIYCANQMTTATRTQILTTLNSFASTATDLERVQTALQFTITSPDSAVQK